MKWCSACKTEKPHTDFYAAKATKDGLQGFCKSCMRLHRARNKPREQAIRAIWREENKEHERATNRAWRRANPEKVKRFRRKGQLRHKYALTPEQYDRMFAAQNGFCGVCGKPPDEPFFAVDHNHETGEVRGLLHRRCNTALGLLGDDPKIVEQAAEYLRGRCGNWYACAGREQP